MGLPTVPKIVKASARASLVFICDLFQEEELFQPPSFLDYVGPSPQV